MTTICENPHPDLTEVREMETGVLLGFIDLPEQEKSIVKIRRPKKLQGVHPNASMAKMFYEAMDTPTIHTTTLYSCHVRIQEDGLLFAWAVYRADWQDYTDALREVE